MDIAGMMHAVLRAAAPSVRVKFTTAMFAFATTTDTLSPAGDKNATPSSGRVALEGQDVGEKQATACARTAS